MATRPLWLQGETGSGKTAWLIDQLMAAAGPDGTEILATGQSFLLFAANGDNRIRLADRIAVATRGPFEVVTTTPNGFMQDEVMLFWPLLVNHLGLLPQFPVRLRPENEQELAARLWQPQLLDGRLQVEGWLEPQTVRRALDFCSWGLWQGSQRRIYPPYCQRAYRRGSPPKPFGEPSGKR
ncbi:MAG: hypothetical protein HC922_06490 [Leptolyngbyaceae cyanobacterium SM2_3_12]|nr:hypothetical protein [Leptolyngbyaceae cyanobacterium SM2_3_12]